MKIISEVNSCPKMEHVFDCNLLNHPAPEYCKNVKTSLNDVKENVTIPLSTI